MTEKLWIKVVKVPFIYFLLVIIVVALVAFIGYVGAIGWTVYCLMRSGEYSAADVETGVFLSNENVEKKLWFQFNDDVPIVSLFDMGNNKIVAVRGVGISRTGISTIDKIKKEYVDQAIFPEVHNNDGISEAVVFRNYNENPLHLLMGRKTHILYKNNHIKTVRGDDGFILDCNDNEPRIVVYDDNREDIRLFSVAGEELAQANVNTAFYPNVIDWGGADCESLIAIEGGERGKQKLVEFSGMDLSRKVIINILSDTYSTDLNVFKCLKEGCEEKVGVQIVQDGGRVVGWNIFNRDGERLQKLNSTALFDEGGGWYISDNELKYYIQSGMLPIQGNQAFGLEAIYSYLWIYDNEGNSVYEEILPEQCAIVEAAKLPEKNKFYLGCEGKVWEYSLGEL